MLLEREEILRQIIDLFLEGLQGDHEIGLCVDACIVGFRLENFFLRVEFIDILVEFAFLQVVVTAFIRAWRAVVSVGTIPRSSATTPRASGASATELVITVHFHLHLGLHFPVRLCILLCHPFG